MVPCIVFQSRTEKNDPQKSNYKARLKIYTPVGKISIPLVNLKG